jgi:hypothetical protein
VKVRLDDTPIRAMSSDVQWDTPGALRSNDRYDLTVYSGCVRVSMDAAAPPRPEPPRASPASDTVDTSPWRADEGVSLVLDGIEQRLRDPRAG